MHVHYGFYIMKNIYLEILNLQPDNFPLVLATVTRVAGSTPQKPGSSALFGLDGLLSGTVGGGIVEGEIQQISRSAIRSKESGHYHFNLDHDISHEKDAICGGQISILVDANPGDHHAVLHQIKQSLMSRIPGVLVSRLTSVRNNKVLIRRYWVTENGKQSVPSEHFQLIEAEVKSLLSAGKAGDYKELEKPIPGQETGILFFLEPVFPPEHLVIAGAGHIGKALAHLGRLLDFEVTVIDDRIEYANPGNIPDADHIIVKDIGIAMQELKKKPDTYVVIVTRGHKDDANALKPCIGSASAYIGMMGSNTYRNFLDSL